MDVSRCDDPSSTLVTMTPVRAGGVRGVWFRLARGASDFAIAALDDGRALVFPRSPWPPDDAAPARSTPLSGAQVKELARVLSGWRRDRRGWAAHAGSGVNLKWMGSDPVYYWAPGKERVTIQRGDRRFAVMVSAACRARLAAPERDQGAYGDIPLYGRLVSHLDEPLGLVLRLLEDRCALLLRGVVVFAGRKWPGDRQLLELAASNKLMFVGHDTASKVVQRDGFVLTSDEAAVVAAVAAELTG